METTFAYFSHNLNYALGWMVVHSLWQATLIAILSGIAAIVFRKKAAQVRYLIHNVALVAVLLAAVVTFGIYYNLSTQPGKTQFVPNRMTLELTDKTTATTPTATTVEAALPKNTPTESLSIEGLKGYFNRNIYLIVTIWLLGVAVFILRLLSGVSYVYYLRSKMNFPSDEYWQEILDNLRERAGIQKVVELVESALVRSPMVVGHLKPLILFPIGAINKLNPSEVEAILAHELAHVLRHDYVFNIIQSVIESLFYFHPAVWWISANIRTERENCCDDKAIVLCGNSMAYAKSLVAVQEMAYFGSPQMAMAFAGQRKNQLLHRVQRILNQSNNKTNVMEKLVATCLLIIGAIVLSVGGNRFDNAAAKISLIGDPSVSAVDFTLGVDTFPLKMKTADGKINYSDNTQDAVLTIENNAVVGLNVNGVDLANADIPKFSRLIDKIVTGIPTPPDAPNSPNSLNAPPTPPTPPSVSGEHFSMNSGNNGFNLNTTDKDGTHVDMSISDDGFHLNGDGVHINMSDDGNGASISKGSKGAKSFSMSAGGGQKTLTMTATNGFSYVTSYSSEGNTFKCYQNGAFLGDLVLKNKKIYRNGHEATADELKQLGLKKSGVSGVDPLMGSFQIQTENHSGGESDCDDCNDAIDDLRIELDDLKGELKGLSSKNALRTEGLREVSELKANLKNMPIDQIKQRIKTLEKKIEKADDDNGGQNNYSYGISTNPDAAQAKRDAEQARRNAEQAQRKGEQAQRNDEQAQRNDEQARRNDEKAQRNAEKAQRNAEDRTRSAEQAQRDREQAQRDREQAQRDREQVQRNSEQTQRDAEQAKNDAFHQELVLALKRDGFLKDNRNFSVSWNNKSMKVNDTEIPAAKVAEYRQMYERISGKKQTGNWSMNWQTSN